MWSRISNKLSLVAPVVCVTIPLLGSSAFGNISFSDSSMPEVILPPNWSFGFDANGHKFYYNTSTNETSWSAPHTKKWKSNWDHREDNKTVVVHQIVLVRHGQYQDNESLDENMKLTAKGWEQAELTGRRLNDLLSAGIVYPVKKVYFSTMQRATETAKGVISQLPENTPSEPCSMIREGAVCRPDPPARNWDVSDEDFEKEGIRVITLCD